MEGPEEADEDFRSEESADLSVSLSGVDPAFFEEALVCLLGGCSGSSNGWVSCPVSTLAWSLACLFPRVPSLGESVHPLATFLSRLRLEVRCKCP